MCIRDRDYGIRYDEAPLKADFTPDYDLIAQKAPSAKAVSYTHLCVIENLPDISDVAVSLKILSVLGAQIKMINRNTCLLYTSRCV